MGGPSNDVARQVSKLVARSTLLPPWMDGEHDARVWNAGCGSEWHTFRRRLAYVVYTVCTVGVAKYPRSSYPLGSLGLDPGFLSMIP